MEVNFPNLPMSAELVEAGEELVTESKEESQPVSFRTGDERPTARKGSVSGQSSVESPMPQSVRNDELLGSGRLLLPPGLQKQLQSRDAPPQSPAAGKADEGRMASDSPSSVFHRGHPKNSDSPGLGKGHGSVPPFPGTGIDRGAGIELPKDTPLPIDLPPPVLQPPSDGGGRQIPSPPVVVGGDPVPVDIPLPPSPAPPKEQPVSPQDGGEQQLPTPDKLPVAKDPVRRADIPKPEPARSEPAPKPVVEAAAQSISEVITSTTSRFHTIPVGQSLEQVAEEFSVDVYSLLEANPHLLKDPLLFAGQRLRVPRNLQPQQEKTHFGAFRVDQNLYAAVKQTAEQVIKFPSSVPAQYLRAEPAHSKPMHADPAPADEPLQLEQTASEMVLEEPAMHSTGSLKRPQPVRADISDEPTTPVKTQEKAISRHDERASEQKTVKQQENLTPGLGAYVTVRREDEEADPSNRKRKPNLSIPAPFDEWADYIYEAAERYMLEPALLAAVIWRESGGKNIVGKDGHGFGLMQIDNRQHSAWLRQNDGLNPELNIDFGASLIRKYIDYFGGRTSHALAAFDCGVDAVEEALVLGKPVDYFTREGNYSLSVLTQMEYFKRFF